VTVLNEYDTRNFQFAYFGGIPLSKPYGGPMLITSRAI